MLSIGGARHSGPSYRASLTASPTGRSAVCEQREWDAIEAAIVAAEEALARCHEAAHDPAVATRADELTARCQALQDAHKEVDRLYARWAELDAKRA